ncbi:MAG: hypothetical protein K9J12_04035 [Melioribacteraceae bacterium]|nr:hypothetical protein [Melioribacteraceae bacterium]MCF8263248.1 hypothetical protein [Melioribacteraceae bacterium]MCF8414491.1 hypothetical protein [Melioribacteraceae bacterium]MCF8430688.1 hypothetical protein [Melioribacteraceae bacterium]
MKRFYFQLCILFLVFASLNAQTLNVQGVLRDSENRTVSDGNYQMLLKLYESETAGTEVFSENHTPSIVNGVYSLDLGSINEIEFRSLDFSKPYWLGVEIDGLEVSERSRLSMSPYLFSPESATNQYPSAGDVILGGSLKLNDEFMNIPNSWGIQNANNRYTLEHATSSTFGTFTYLSAGKGSGQDLSSMVSDKGFYLMRESATALMGTQLLHLNPSSQLSLRYGLGHEPRGVLDIYSRGVGFGVRFSDQFEISSSDYNWPGVVFGFNAILSAEDNNNFWMKADDPNRTGAMMYNTGGELFFKGIKYSESADPSGNQHFVDDFRYNLTIRADGRIGIGTDDPEGNLDVRGIVRMISKNTRWTKDDINTLDADMVFESDGFVVITADRGGPFNFAFFLREDSGSWVKLGGFETEYGQLTGTIPVIGGETYQFDFFEQPTSLSVYYFKMGR